MIFHRLFLLAALFSLQGALCQNKFNSHLFYSKPTLYNSKSKVAKLNLSRYDVLVALPVDHRSNFYGEVIYKDIKIHPLGEFFKSPVVVEIQNKINSDLNKIAPASTHKPHDKLSIETSVEVFYPRVSGFIRGKSTAKVRLGLAALVNDSLLMTNTYESFYMTDATDKEFEGDLTMTVEDGVNVTLGMALRKTLDQFYLDLNAALKSKQKEVVIAGKITNSKTGAPLVATVSFRADSVFVATSSADGKYRLTMPLAKHYNIKVQASDFVTVSEGFDLRSSFLKMTERNFSLQRAEVGTVVPLKNVLFYMGTDNLLEESYDELNGVVAFLKAHPKIKIELHGHTDNQGNASKDVVLSQQRVDRIKSYLVSKNISARRIQGKGFGGTKPIASNESEEGRRLNRRVEFVIVKN